VKPSDGETARSPCASLAAIATAYVPGFSDFALVRRPWKPA
jgi:hypothetical protein